MELTEEQKNHWLQISLEAKHFLVSELYKEFQAQVKKEYDQNVEALVNDRRGDTEKNLTRMEFVERRCAYLLAISEVINKFIIFAGIEKELKKSVKKP